MPPPTMSKKLYRLSADSRVLADQVEVADRFWQRAVGLMGRRNLPPGHALLITPCSAVHTFFMRFPLDLVFIDRNFRVARIIREVRPARLCSGGRQAYAVLEAQPGWLPENALPIGTPLKLERAE